MKPLSGGKIMNISINKQYIAISLLFFTATSVCVKKEIQNGPLYNTLQTVTAPIEEYKKYQVKKIYLIRSI